MKTVISLTSIPDRIEHIESCIRSLVAQGLPVYLWAVKKVARSDTILQKLPGFLKDAGVHVEIVEDCGPITKLLPALKANFDVIITADDDCVYGEGWAKHLLAWSKKIPRAALGYRGRILKGDTYRDSRLVLKSRIKKVVAVDVITGVYGALYKRTMFDAGIYEEWERWPMNDELVITAHLKRRGVRRYVVPAKCKITDTRTRAIAPLYGMNTSAVHLNDDGIKVLGLEKKRK